MSLATRRRADSAAPALLDSARPPLRLLHPQHDEAARERADVLLQKIRTRTATVGVVGLGYVGLPFAVEQARAGFRVVGIDLNLDKVKKVNAGENFIGDVKDEDLAEMVRKGRLEAVADFAAAGDLDVLVLAIPTPLTRHLQPDLTYVTAATRELARVLRPGQLLSLESTTFPGTTREVMLPLLEAAGLKAEQDFFLAHSPERVDPGNRHYLTRNTPKVVGGVGPLSQEVAVAFYSQAIEQVIPVGSAEAAELVKVYENTFRAVNIALVNEMTLLCDRMGLDVWEVLDAAFTKPFGIMPFYPGPGVGGHCIPLDPHYLEFKAKEFNFQTRFIALAGDVNRRMPEFVRDKVHRLLNRQGLAPSRSRILLLGMAYKKNVGDCRESPALEVARLLQEDGADVVYHDPHVPYVEEHGLEMKNQPLTEDLLAGCDLTVVLTEHACFDYPWIAAHARHVLDTRNALRLVTVDRDKITRL